MALSMRERLRHVWAWRTILILLLTPLALLPIPLVLQSSEADCAYVVFLMAVFWITEAIPVGVTSLFPVFLFPMFGIVSGDDIARQYMNDVNMLFVGGLMMAVAIEYWDIHKRIALKITLLVGTEPRWLMLGLMVATWFLSMWISNTATTAMMVTIADAILVQLQVTKRTKKKNGDDIEMNKTTVDNTDERNDDNSKDHPNQTKLNFKDNDPDDKTYEDPHFVRLGKGMSLCICYAANSGGIASLTGTGPNLVLKGMASTLYKDRGIRSPVTFGTWMSFGLPVSICMLIVTWLWLQIVYLRCSGACSCCAKKGHAEEEKGRIRDVILKEYKGLGSIVFGQVLVFVLFVILVLLWVTRDLGGVGGWGSWFHFNGSEYLDDGAPAILIASLLFILPSTIPCLSSYSDPAHPEKWKNNRMENRSGPPKILPLLNWKAANEKMPWQLMFLLGGGYALSKGCNDSGLSLWIGKQLEFFSDWNSWAVLFIICYITAAATEVTSNTAIATLLMPIMAQLAINTASHPLYYMFPSALSCSFAFMLPVATPPNAIVFAYGRLKVIDMVSTGFIMNLLAVPILVVLTSTLGNAIFDFDAIPVEFLTNTTNLMANATTS